MKRFTNAEILKMLFWHMGMEEGCYRQTDYMYRHRTQYIHKFARSLFLFTMAVKYRYDILFHIQLVKYRIRDLERFPYIMEENMP